jgi:hypothetical protein
VIAVGGHPAMPEDIPGYYNILLLFLKNYFFLTICFFKKKVMSWACQVTAFSILKNYQKGFLFLIYFHY